MNTGNTSASSTTRALLSAAISIVCAAALGATLWLVFSSRADALVAEDAVASQTAQGEALRRLAFEGAATKADRARLSSLAIARGDNASFISSVEALGRSAKAGASVSSVSATAPSQNAPGTLSLSVQFSGTYTSCLRFVGLIETMPVALSVSGLALDSDGTGNWSGTLSFSALSLDTP